MHFLFPFQTLPYLKLSKHSHHFYFYSFPFTCFCEVIRLHYSFYFVSLRVEDRSRLGKPSSAQLLTNWIVVQGFCGWFVLCIVVLELWKKYIFRHSLVLFGKEYNELMSVCYIVPEIDNNDDFEQACIKGKQPVKLRSEEAKIKVLKIQQTEF